MKKSVALLFAFIFLAASCLIVANPASSSVAVAENTWAEKAPLPQGKNGVLVVVDGKIYAIGGTAQNYVSGVFPLSGYQNAVDTNYEYDPALDKWTIKPPMPTSRYGFATVVYENSIYCIGGVLNLLDVYGGVVVPTTAVEVFHISTNKWENKTSMPTRRGNFATMVYEDDIYCIGERVNEVYDIATDTWQTKAPMPFNGSIASANVVNGKLYVISDSLMYVYNPAMDTWFTRASIQTEGNRIVSAVIDRKIYVITENLTQTYDTETDTVSIGAPPPTDFSAGIAFATTGKMAPRRIYILYGAVSVYDPEADSWIIGAKMPTSSSSYALMNDKIYAIGGITTTIISYRRIPSFPKDILAPNISYSQLAANWEYTPFGYGTVPPVISVASPENSNYTLSEVALNFTVNRRVEWMRYSLDGNENVTLTGNTTLTGLSAGLHNVTVYAKDEFGNTGVSETIVFSVAEEPFPAVPVAVASVATIAVVGVGLLVYFKKRKH